MRKHLAALTVVVHSAVDGERTKPRIAADGVRILADLDDKLASRRNDKRPRIAPFLGTVLGTAQIARENRHQERRGLAGPGLRLAGDVLARERLLERERLNLSAILEPEISDTVHHL